MPSFHWAQQVIGMKMDLEPVTVTWSSGQSLLGQATNCFKLWQVVSVPKEPSPAGHRQSTEHSNHTPPHLPKPSTIGLQGVASEPLLDPQLCPWEVTASFWSLGTIWVVQREWSSRDSGLWGAERSPIVGAKFQSSETYRHKRDAKFTMWI